MRTAAPTGGPQFEKVSRPDGLETRCVNPCGDSTTYPVAAEAATLRRGARGVPPLRGGVITTLTFTECLCVES